MFRLPFIDRESAPPRKSWSGPSPRMIYQTDFPQRSFTSSGIMPDVHMTDYLSYPFSVIQVIPTLGELTELTQNFPTTALRCKWPPTIKETLSKSFKYPFKVGFSHLLVASLWRYLLRTINGSNQNTTRTSPKNLLYSVSIFAARNSPSISVYIIY